MQSEILPANKLPRISANVTQRANIFLLWNGGRPGKDSVFYDFFLWKAFTKHWNKTITRNTWMQARSPWPRNAALLNQTLALWEEPANKITCNFTQNTEFHIGTTAATLPRNRSVCCARNRVETRRFAPVESLQHTEVQWSWHGKSSKMAPE